MTENRMVEDLNSNRKKVLFWPIFLTATFINILDCVSMLLDEAIIGNLFDDAAFGAINLTEPYGLVESFLSYLILTGGAAMIVRARGENNKKMMEDIFSHCITLCLLLGLLFVAIFTAFRTQLAYYVAGGTKSMPYVLQVVSWNRLSWFMDPIMSFLLCYVLYMGGCILVAVDTVVFIGSNVALSVFLAKRMGIGGVVFASGIAKIIGVLLLLLFFVNKNRRMSFRPYMNWNMAKELALIGFPESSFILSISLMEAVINQTAISHYGIQGIAVATVAINVYEIIIYVSEGISEYETTALNEYLGQGSRTRVDWCIRIVKRAAVIEGLIFSILLFVGAEGIVAIFDVDDAFAAEMAARSVQVVAVISIIICLTRVLAIFYQYTGRTLRAAALIDISWGVLPALLGMLLGSVSIIGITAGIALGASLVLLFMIPFVRQIKKEKLWFISDERMEMLRKIDYR